jgi:beta-lactamase regulating signal transducer with metallopeptidase domain
VGATIMLIYGILSYLLLKHKMREATLTEGGVMEAGNIKTPFVLGIFAPKVYLPKGLTGGERAYILLHEQTHIKRHDPLVKCAAYFILCLHWFNPLVWAAFLLLSADMEMACDEQVVKRLGLKIRCDYALSLVRIASGRSLLAENKAPWLDGKQLIRTGPLAFGEGNMKERVKRILNYERPPAAFTVITVSLAVALGAGFSMDKIDETAPVAELTSAIAMPEPDALPEAAEVKPDIDTQPEIIRT